MKNDTTEHMTLEQALAEKHGGRKARTDPHKPHTGEKALENEIMTALRAEGHVVTKIGDDKKFGAMLTAVQRILYGNPALLASVTAVLRSFGNGNQAGAPDILVHPKGTEAGFLVGVEIKTERGALTPEQKEAWAAGALVVVRSVEEAVEAIDYAESIMKYYDNEAGLVKHDQPWYPPK